MSSLPLIACHDCDLLQRKASMPPGGSGRCRRCGSVLCRDYAPGPDRSLACTIAAFILFLIANAFPIVELNVKGSRQAASLYDAVHTLWVGGREDMALLVGCTTMLLPALEMALLIYVLVPWRFNRIVIGAVPVLRFIQTVRPWSMMEVFLLGILVSLVKLQHMAHVEAGIALWAFGGLIPMLTAASISFNSEELWAKIRR